MKTLCTLLLALGTLCSIQAQERKVNQPPFIVRNTSTVEINQITLSDTATVLDIKAYYRPHNWIRISGESYLLADNGKKYPIRSGSGITLDKEFWMPDSGEATFSLIFPTLPATVKTIDFIESDCEDCFKVWGISLNGKLPELVLPEEVKQKTNAVEILPAPQLTMGKATLSGKLLDYKHNYQLNLNAYLCELLTGNENEIPIEIKEDGSFCTAIDLSAPTSLDLVMGREKISTLFMTPGEDTKIIINLREISRSQSKLLKQNKPEGEKLYFSGTMAQLNKTLNSKWATEWEGKDFLKEIYNMSAEEYKAYCLNKYQNRNSIIQNAKELDNASRQLLLIDNKFQCTAALNSINSNLMNAHIYYSGLPEREAFKSYKAPDLPINYYDYIRTIGALNSNEMLYYNGYSRMLKYLGYEIRVPLDGNMKDIFSYIISSDRTSAEDAAVIKAYKDSIDAGKSAKALAEKMQDLRKKYDPLFMEYSKKVQEAGMKVVTNYMGTDKGLFFDIRKAMKYAEKITDFRPLTETDFQEIRLMENPYYLEKLTSMNNKLIETIEANKKKTGFTINETGEVANEDLFASIISKFRGKVMLVDFWATWCGPCQKAMKDMKPMKEELADKDIVYLFIAGENSPKETWENMISDIHGEHYRLTNAQWAYINKQFSIQGVPTYMIIDKEGGIKNKFTGFPGVDTVKKQLLELL